MARVQSIYIKQVALIVYMAHLGRQVAGWLAPVGELRWFFGSTLPIPVSLGQPGAGRKSSRLGGGPHLLPSSDTRIGRPMATDCDLLRERWLGLSTPVESRLQWTLPPFRLT